MISASQVYSPASPDEAERALARDATVWMWSKIDLGVEALGVLLEARHQVGPLHAVGVGGPVVDVGRRHQLAALRETGDQDGLEVRARGVYCGGVTGRAGAQDDQSGVLGGHEFRFVAMQKRAEFSPCAGAPRRASKASAPTLVAACDPFPRCRARRIMRSVKSAQQAHVFQ